MVILLLRAHRLDSSVQAPHERSGLTPLQYSMWLDTHTTEDVLRGIKSALQAAGVGSGAKLQEGASQEQQAALRVILQLCQQAGE